MSFPKNFFWGAATASYQIEGAAHEDGRGDSVWDMLCRKQDAIWGGQTGEIACDHYHRFKEDVAIMKAMGLRGYRFSISWPRVIPEGAGRVNKKGLAFYDRLVDELLAAGVAPWVTLFHWDYPLELFYRGGWLNADSPQWFADYTAVVVDKLGDRVKHWMTMNEPQCFIGLGHFDGMHAPGIKLPWKEILLAGKHALLAHGRAVQVIRARAKARPVVGSAPIGTSFFPASDSKADVEAARTAMFVDKERSFWSNGMWHDPMYTGKYPRNFAKLYGSDFVPPTEKEARTMAQKLDFFGFNLYSGMCVKADKNGRPEVVNEPPGFPITHFNWTVQPQALHWAVRFFHERYKLPIVVSENGLSNLDWVASDGKVHDPQRIDFTRKYLKALSAAGDAGAKLMGYFHWSLMDNFEWAEGYKHRFGMVHVDYTTLKRTMKDSAYWYRNVIAANGENLQ